MENIVLSCVMEISCAAGSAVWFDEIIIKNDKKEIEIINVEKLEGGEAIEFVYMDMFIDTIGDRIKRIYIY